MRILEDGNWQLEPGDVVWMGEPHTRGAISMMMCEKPREKNLSIMGGGFLSVEPVVANHVHVRIRK